VSRPRGNEQVITEAMLARLRDTAAENARRLRLDADLVMVHDASPLGLVEQRGTAGRWVWRCHQDLSSAQPQIWSALRPIASATTRPVFSLARSRRRSPSPFIVIRPSIRSPSATAR